MAALPYIQLYIADYLADTAHLTTVQHGAYLLLIFNYWQRGHALNNANGRLASVVRMSNEEWAQHEQTLAEFFEVDGDEWRNHRIDEDLAAVEARSIKASMAGKASGATRRANAKRKSNARSANVERTLNHTDTDTDTDTDKEKNRARAKSRKTPLPENFGVSERVKRWADEKGYARLPERLEHFVGAAKAKGYTYIDWDEALMNAIRQDWAKLGAPIASPPKRRMLGDPIQLSPAAAAVKRRLEGET